MESKINIIRRDLRGLKKSSLVIKRLIEAQKLHYIRIEALNRLPKSQENDKIIEKEKAVIATLGVEKAIMESQGLIEKYSEAISNLLPLEKAMVIDHFIKGYPFWRLANDYGYTEESVRKKMDRILKKL